MAMIAEALDGSKAAWFRKGFSFPVFLGALLVLGVFIRARQNPMDPDTWWHLAVGDRILEQASWPEADPYSFTVAGNPWIAYEWLGEVVMAAAARWGGLEGRTLLLIAWSSVFFLLLYYYCYLRSRNWKTAFVACAVLLPLATIFFTLRPQLLGYIFLVLTLICLERFRQGSERALWFLPVIFLVWVNTHGTFVFGLFAAGLYLLSGLIGFEWGGITAERWTDQQRLRLETVLLLCVAALAITPYGTRLAAYPLEMALLQPANVRNIVEWQPLGPELLFGKLFIALLFLYFLGQLVSRQTYRIHELALLLFGIFCATVHRRFLMLFVIFFAPLVAALLVRWLPPYQPAKDHFVLNAALMVLACVAMVLYFPSEQELEERVNEDYPQQAMQYLRANPVEGPVWNEYGWGGYLIWAGHPNHRVFIDGRADIYEYGGVLGDYMRISGLDPETFSLLRKYDVRACLVRNGAPLATLLETAPGWGPAYRDKVSVLFVYRETPARSSPATEKPELLQAALETVPKR
jgi:hypothetical protein